MLHVMDKTVLSRNAEEQEEEEEEKKDQEEERKSIVEDMFLIRMLSFKKVSVSSLVLCCFVLPGVVLRSILITYIFADYCSCFFSFRLPLSPPVQFQFLGCRRNLS